MSELSDPESGRTGPQSAAQRYEASRQRRPIGGDLPKGCLDLKQLAVAGLICALQVVCPTQVKADKPYFVTYDDQMEQPGNFEISLNPVIGLPQTGHRFVGMWTEF